MRPETACRRVQKAIIRRINNPNSRSIYRVMPEIMELLKRSVSRDKKTCRDLNIDYIPDNRTGYETYGYDKQTIRGSLFYISDRFNATFRLRWLKDGIEGNHF